MTRTEASLAPLGDVVVQRLGFRGPAESGEHDTEGLCGEEGVRVIAAQHPLPSGQRLPQHLLRQFEVADRTLQVARFVHGGERVRVVRAEVRVGQPGDVVEQGGRVLLPPRVTCQVVGDDPHRLDRLRMVLTVASDRGVHVQRRRRQGVESDRDLRRL
nr:hypothetical protein [Saccharomonospora azurea]